LIYLLQWSENDANDAVRASPHPTELGGIETKTGNSRYHPSQRAKDEWLRQNGYPVDLVRDP
jgi:hypothetical protein